MLLATRSQTVLPPMPSFFTPVTKPSSAATTGASFGAKISTPSWLRLPPSLLSPQKLPIFPLLLPTGKPNEGPTETDKLYSPERNNSGCKRSIYVPASAASKLNWEDAVSAESNKDGSMPPSLKTSANKVNGTFFETEKLILSPRLAEKRSPKALPLSEAK